MISIREANKNDMSAIANIFNEELEKNNTILLERKIDETERRNWWLALREKGFPIFVADENGKCCGYANFGSFRNCIGFRHTAELSIYVEKESRGKDIGKMLLETLIEKAKEKKIHVLISGISADSLDSIELHKQCGFFETARMPEVTKIGDKWIDFIFMQKSIV